MQRRVKVEMAKTFPFMCLMENSFFLLLLVPLRPEAPFMYLHNALSFYLQHWSKFLWSNYLTTYFTKCFHTTENCEWGQERTFQAVRKWELVCQGLRQWLRLGHSERENDAEWCDHSGPSSPCYWHRVLPKGNKKPLVGKKLRSDVPGFVGVF